MTIPESNMYVAKQGLEKNPLNDHSYGFTPLFFTQPPHIPNAPVDKKDYGLDEILEDLFIIGAENPKRMGQEDIWDIIKEFVTPNVPDVMDDVIQLLIPKTIHTTPPNEDCVVPATKPILDELLEEFREEILNVTMVDEEADFNPTRDIKEL
ncbi:hypothetical protein Tco_0755302 [Tanacetum coccineum]